MTKTLTHAQQSDAIQGGRESPVVGHLTRSILANMVRTGDKEHAFDVIERARESFANNVHHVGDRHIPENPVEPLVAINDEGTSIIHTMERGILVTMVCPPGPVRIGDNVIWIEKTKVPDTLWTKLNTMSHQGVMPSEYVGLTLAGETFDLDKGTISGITRWEADDIFTQGEEFLFLYMDPVTYPIDEVQKYLEDIARHMGEDPIVDKATDSPAT